MKIRSAAQRANESRIRQQAWEQRRRAEIQEAVAPAGSWWTEPDFRAAHRREFPRLTTAGRRAVYRTIDDEG